MAGNHMTVSLKGALYIPSYPQNTFSFKSAMANWVTITFKKNENELVYWNGYRFNVYVYNWLYYQMSTENKPEDSCQGCYDINTWHRMFGHCYYDDVKKLPYVVEWVKIKEKIGTLNKDWNLYPGKIFSEQKQTTWQMCNIQFWTGAHWLSWSYRPSWHKQTQISHHIHWCFFQCSICIFSKI